MLLDTPLSTISIKNLASGVFDDGHMAEVVSTVSVLCQKFPCKCEKALRSRELSYCLFFILYCMVGLEK